MTAKFLGSGPDRFFFRSGPDFFSLLDFGSNGLASPFFGEFRNPFLGRQICQIPATAAPRLLNGDFAENSPNRFFVHIEDRCQILGSLDLNHFFGHFFILFSLRARLALYP